MFSRDARRTRASQTHQHPDESDTLGSDSQPVLRTQSLRQHLAKYDDGRARDHDRKQASSARERVEKDGCVATFPFVSLCDREHH